MTNPGRPFARQDPHLPDRERGPDLAALPSRRRSRESHGAVLRATVDLLNEVGVAGTMTRFLASAVTIDSTIEGSSQMLCGLCSGG